MGIKVLKFGGSSLADAKQFKRVADIIKSQDERRYIVASAPGKRFADDEKVTDLLYMCYNLAVKKEDISEVFSKIKDRYNTIISDLGLNFSLESEFERIQMSIIHHAGRDYVASRGEYLNALILAKYIGYDFIDAEGIVFFDENGHFEAELTNEVMSRVLRAHERAVIPGFYGVSANGTIKTFSRGGSDITGSIVARAIDADLYENWTDVSGMLMADPRLVENPKTIRFITYKELRELSYMGATVLHEDAVFPVREAGIPINIRNTNQPLADGTMIVPQISEEDDVSDCIITGIAGKKGFSTVTVEKSQMDKVFIISEISRSFKHRNINIEHMPTGIDAISFVVSTESLRGNEEDLVASFNRHVAPDAVTFTNSIALIAVVGRKMVQSAGTAGKVFSAIGDAGVNVKMIDQGSSELNIIIAVEEADYVKAMRAIYYAFSK